MINFAEQAVSRVEEFLKQYDTDQPAEIIADILHYCQAKGIDFEGEVELPQDLDDFFAISESQAEWEAENEDEEELTEWIKDGLEARKEGTE
jgi:ribosomal protein S10